MKTIKIEFELTDELYDGYLLDSKYQIQSPAGLWVYDEKQIISFLECLGSGYKNEIETIKKVLKVLINNDMETAFYLQRIVFGGGLRLHFGKITKPDKDFLIDYLNDPKRIECVEVWNKYHPDDMIDITEFKNNSTEDKNN
ncbi:MAG: hypothetical protein WD512_07225 [Candidatus Paceibacterota bacterium]